LLLEEPLGRQRMGRFQAIAGFRFQSVKRDGPSAAAAFLGVEVFVKVRTLGSGVGRGR
jgi:hypothetical protein